MLDQALVQVGLLSVIMYLQIILPGKDILLSVAPILYMTGNFDSQVYADLDLMLVVG